jgi:high-affinity iron transporter
MKFIFNIGHLVGFVPIGLLVSCAARPSAPAAADRGDAQRLVALVDYIGGDYGRAVAAGRVVSPGEYEEQLRFAADARNMAKGLLGSSPDPADPLLSHLAEVASLVGAKADAEEVARACRSAREEAVARFHLKTVPTARPSLARAEALYAESCATCHGVRGDADTERARALDPRPARFKEPARLGELSPHRVYNALTFGVPGTAMASFEALSPADRWSLAFYVFRLGHEGEETAGPAAMTLADMAVRTDREILDGLKDAAHPAPEQVLAYVRREAAFTEPPAGVGIDLTRGMLRRALATYTGGRRGEADRLVIDAYLEGFEPLEPRLRTRDPAATVEVEAAFRDLRTVMTRGEPADRVRAALQSLDHRLRDICEGRRRPLLPAAAAFLIFFREGLEAALVVAALLAGLRRLGRRDAARSIHGGWLLALPAGVATWWLLDRAFSLGADKRELIEAAVGLAAAAVLFSVSFWMISKAESRRWMGYLSQKLEAGLDRKSIFMLSGLAFLAVYREAAETVLFTQALLLESERAQVLAGAAAGLLAVVVAAFVLNRTVLRLPIGPFFAVSSALMCALAVSFAGSGIYALVAAGYLTPRPVRFPEVAWAGIHPDLTALLVQLTIVLTIATAGLVGLRRRYAADAGGRAS